MGRPEADTWMGGADREFGTTLWTVVVRAKDPASPERREALQKLIEIYWKPLYHYVRRKGHDAESAKDAVQSFFTAVLEKDLLQYVQPGRARFRTFLMLALKHHMSDAWDRSRAQKRGGGQPPVSLDFLAAESEMTTVDTPEQAFRREWGTRVLEQAMDALREEHSAAGKAAEFAAIKPYLGQGVEPRRSYSELAAALKLTETDVRNRIHRARNRYRELVLHVIRAYTESAEEVDDELRDLFAAFS